MKNPELYQKTVDILVNAYFNDTLAHGNCCACAVGNIIANNMGYEINKCADGIFPYEWRKNDKKLPYPAFSDYQTNNNISRGATGWGAVFCTNGKIQRINRHYLNEVVKAQIDSTGYSLEQLAKIEYAFETAAKKGDRMFNGLMAVVDVLDEIHENKNEELTISTKKRFSKNECLTEL